MNQIAPKFLEAYFDLISKYACFDDYIVSDEQWTKKIMAIAKWSIYQTLLKCQTRNPKFRNGQLTNSLATF
jgi:hypothetical protein